MTKNTNKASYLSQSLSGGSSSGVLEKREVLVSARGELRPGSSLGPISLTGCTEKKLLTTISKMKLKEKINRQ